MFSFIWYTFNWFKAFGSIERLLDKVIGIGGTSIKFIALWIKDILSLLFKLGMWSFWEEVWFICGWSLKRLQTRIELFIFVSYFVFCCALRFICRFIPGLSFKWNVFLLIFNSWNNLLSHLWFVTRVIFSIWRINVTIWCFQIFCVFIISKCTVSWKFLCVTERMGYVLLLIGRNFLKRDVNLE